MGDDRATQTLHPDDFDAIAAMRDKPPPPTEAAVEANRLFYEMLAAMND